MKWHEKKFSFRVGLSTLVVLTVAAITGLSLWNVQRLSTRAALEMAEQLFGEISSKIAERLETDFSSITFLADSAASMPSMMVEPVGGGLEHPGLEFMFGALERQTSSTSMYLGFPSGAFLQVVAPRENPEVLKGYGAPPKTEFVVRAISPDGSGHLRQHWTYLNQGRQILNTRTDDDPHYDPRQRPWYIQALEAPRSGFTKPYVFAILQVPGLTCFRRLPGQGGVFGIDFTLTGISEYLRKQNVSPNGDLFIFDPQGRLIAHPLEKVVGAAGDGKESSPGAALLAMKASRDPNVTALVNRLDDIGKNMPQGIFRMKSSGQAYLTKITMMSLNPQRHDFLAIMAPFSDFTGHIRQMQVRNSLLSILVFVVLVPLALWVSARMSKSLSHLSREATKVQRFDFSESDPIPSVIKEIHALVASFDLMKKEIRQRTEALIATQKKLEILVERGISLAAERDVARLLELIFLAAKALSLADGGVLYLRENGALGDRLEVKIVKNDSLGISLGGESGRPVPSTSLPLYGLDGRPNHAHIVVETLFSEKTQLMDDLEKTEEFDFSGICASGSDSDCETKTILATPLKTRQGEVIGVLVLLNARDPETGLIGPFNPEVVPFVEALAAQAAVALDNKNLLIAQQNLLDSFIKLLAGAIDAKSPYTGGHCARVPVIASLLAEAAHQTREGPFQDFRFETSDQWLEFRTAAWLHDCGKVTTPEYVVDKATKLETLYNRIHEIRMRFEVLWRDAEIDFWQKKAEGVEDLARLKGRLETALEKIRADFAFVAQCNIGGEFMSDDKLDRLKQIGRQTWQRNLDDRLGLSQAEENRRSPVESEDLPAEEFLLSDKPEHIIPRVDKLSYDPGQFGIAMSVPDHLYHLGEIHNLSIRKGTLSEEERFKINEHIIQTIIMLEGLPFPKTMLRVAEYAGAHHETMVGTGYPRRLARQAMSVPARIMAIADIFEALTASDRPYKKAKTLSESLRIMSFMRNDGHIDSELFDLFLKSGIWKEYAEEYLAAAQIDHVDISKYLAKKR